MKISIISEKEEPWVEKLKEAFAKEEIICNFVEIGNTSLSVLNGVPKLHLGTEEMPDAVLLHVHSAFMLYVEPMLNELMEKGIYCQIKPTAFNYLATKPFTYNTLNSKGIPIRKTSYVSNMASLRLDGFNYPILIEAFSGIQKVQRMIVESEATANSFLKSITRDFDAIGIQEYDKADMQQTLVIGDEICTLNFKWCEDKLEHSDSYSMTHLNDKDQQTIIKAARAVGLDIGTVYTIAGKVVNVRQLINFKRFANEDAIDVFAKIASYYKKKLGGTQ